MKVVYDPATQIITMTGRSWHDSLPVARLGPQLAFYRRMAAHKAGKYAHVYAPTVTALEAVQSEISAQGGQNGG